MLRMANQSIFADMLEAIQGRLLRPDLEISVISRDCDFFLDFSRGVLVANSLFEVATVGSGEPGAQETLVIAQIKGTVSVETRTQMCSQRLLSPQLRMVFDDAMHASARVLALHSLAADGVAASESGEPAGRRACVPTATMRVCTHKPSTAARASTDGVGRAAAAGTGLLANVVAGVGTAIGASRTGPDADSFYGGGGSGPIGGGRRDTSSTGDGSEAAGGSPLVQLYRRPGPTEGEAGQAAAGAVAPTDTPSGFGGYGSGGGSSRGAEIDTPPWGGRSTSVGAATEVAVGGGVSSPLGSGSGDLNGRRGRDLTGEAAGESDGGGAERRSALGMASATGGAVLRGLWGGVQMAAAAGVAVAAQGGSGGGDGEAAAAAGSGGGREAGPSPALRLYRRDGDDSD
ncbi:unnamed protein product [Scytosiphon promiscuus]